MKLDVLFEKVWGVEDFFKCGETVESGLTYFEAVDWCNKNGSGYGVCFYDRETKMWSSENQLEIKVNY